jgi:hypothetical protein
MAKNPTRFAEQTTEEAMQGTIHGMNWMREIAEQNLDQTRMLLENLLAITRKAMDDIDHQSSEFRQRSLLVAEEMLSKLRFCAQASSCEGTAGTFARAMVQTLPIIWFGRSMGTSVPIKSRARFCSGSELRRESRSVFRPRFAGKCDLRHSRRAQILAEPRSR